MKNYYFFFLSCFCLFGLTSCGWIFSEEKTEVSLISKEKMIQAESSSKESKRNQEDKTECNISEEIQYLLKNFGRKWVNYTDIYERNQSVKNYLSDRCIKENGIDNDPHLQYKTIGRIHTITQDVIQSDQYLLFGEETTNEMTRFVLLQIKVDQEVQKIDKIKIYYVRSAY